MAWYVVISATRQERRALESLKEGGVSAYLPCEARYVRHARTKTRKEYPLLPGYLFAELGEADLYTLRGLDGVHGVVRSGGRARPINPLFVGALAFLEAMGEFDRTIPSASKPAVTVGSSVVVEAGPMKERHGVVKELRKNHRALVVLEALGVFGAGPAELDLAQLSAA